MPRFKPTPEKPFPGKPGRPSTFSQEIADRICELMVSGLDMEEICARKDMPSRMTVWRWQRDRPDFDRQCARAREALADFELHKMKMLVDNCDETNVNSVRAKLNHYQWRVMKIAPRIYSDKAQIEVTGANGGPVQVETKKIDPRQLSREERDTLMGIIEKMGGSTDN